MPVFGSQFSVLRKEVEMTVVESEKERALVRALSLSAFNFRLSTSFLWHRSLQNRRLSRRLLAELVPTSRPSQYSPKAVISPSQPNQCWASGEPQIDSYFPKTWASVDFKPLKMKRILAVGLGSPLLRYLSHNSSLNALGFGSGLPPVAYHSAPKLVCFRPPAGKSRLGVVGIAIRLVTI